MSQFVEEDESQQSDYEIGLYTVEDLQNITMEALNEALKQKKKKETGAGVELKLRRTDTKSSVDFKCECEGCGVLGRFLGL